MSANEDRISPQRPYLAGDLHRPRYHFTAPQNWLNDPNGLIHWRGEYHLFYQHHPHSTDWGPMHWGHAVSSDLVHWRDLPIALFPDSPADRDGCWSGCAVEEGGRPVLMYTGVSAGEQRPCVAVGSQDLLQWTKHPANPVISDPPEGVRGSDFRDHSLWKEPDGWWYQVIGSARPGQGGFLPLYRSLDLVHWQPLGELLSAADLPAESLPTGQMWECPSFFALDDRHVLLISAFDESVPGKLAYTLWMSGRYRDQRFVPQRVEKLDGGNAYFYAPQVMVDAQGRRLMFGWVGEGRSAAARAQAGWAGVISLPRSLFVDAQGTLCQRFVPELQALRGPEHRLSLAMDDAGEHALPTFGRAVELRLRVEPQGANQSGLLLARTPDGAEETRLVLDWERGRILLERGRSSLDAEVERGDLSAPMPALRGGGLDIHCFWDHSVLELLAGDCAALTARLYPTRADAEGLALFSDGPVHWDVQLWPMQAIWD